MLGRSVLGGALLFAAGVAVGLAAAGAITAPSQPDQASLRPAYFEAGRFPEVGEQLRAKADRYIGEDAWFPHNVMQWNDRLFVDVRQPAIGFRDKLIQWVFVYRWDGALWQLEEYYQAEPG